MVTFLFVCCGLSSVEFDRLAMAAVLLGLVRLAVDLFLLLLSNGLT
jgi:hypothetical protein